MGKRSGQVEVRRSNSLADFSPRHLKLQERNMLEIESVIPILVYEDIAAAHDFLVEAFGFISGGIHRNPEGKAIHAEVRAGERVIW